MAAAARATVQSGVFGRISAGLVSSTALTRSAPSPFDNFGLAATRRLGPPVARREQGFTLAEARQRIVEFLEGTFTAKRLNDLLEYLSSKGMRLESRRSRDGSSAHYLVDVATSKSLPAASVDRRLSRQGVARMFGSTLEEEAEALRQSTTRTPEQILAQKLRSANAGRLLFGDANSKPFDSWEDIRFSAPAMFGGRELTVQGGEIYIGHEYGVAAADPARNLEMIRRAKEEGRKLIVPARTAADANAGRLIPGMPILLKDGAIATRVIDERLSYAGLTRMFGTTVYDYVADLQKRFDRSRIETGGERVVDMAAFRQKFARRKTPVVDIEAAERQVTVAAPVVKRPSRFSIRQDVGDDGREMLMMVDLSTSRAERFDPAVLGAGRFPKEDAFGLPAGMLVVTADGGYAHQNREGRFHNVTGPAIIPPAGSGQPSRYAIDGQILNRREFEEQTGMRARQVTPRAGEEAEDRNATRYSR